MNGKFHDQPGGITGIFEQWGVCERTVVMCVLVRRLPWSGLKMLQRCVDDALLREAPAAAECVRLEREANDEALLANLLATQNETDDADEGLSALERLVTLAPLSGASAAILMVRAVPTLVQRCLTSSSHTCPLARRLLTYLLVHPALVNHHHHQRTLTECLKYLENNISDNSNPDSIWSNGESSDTPLIPSGNIWGSNGGSFRRTIGKNIEFRSTFDTLVDQYNSDLQESFSKNGRDVDISIDEDRLNFDGTIVQPKSQRSNSLTPPTSNFMSSSAENLSEEPFMQKPRSFSLSSEHSLGQLRPIGVFGTTGSETRLDVLRSHNGLEPGMCTVGPWLKSLRLHKYIWLFSNITYNQMMAIDEEYLEKLGVTLGARHKLVISIARIRSLGAALQSAARGESPARASLLTVRAALRAPLHPQGPHAVVSVLDRVSRELLSNGAGPATVINDRRDSLEEDDGSVDPISLHCWLVEKALQHPSFQAPALCDQLRGMRYRLPPRQFYHRLCEMPNSRGLRHTRFRGRGGWTRPRWSAPGPMDALCLQMAETAID